MVGTPLAQIFTAAGYDLIALLESMLKLDPLQRCTATEVSHCAAIIFNIFYFYFAITVKSLLFFLTIQ